MTELVRGNVKVRKRGRGDFEVEGWFHFGDDVNTAFAVEATGPSVIRAVEKMERRARWKAADEGGR